MLVRSRFLHLKGWGGGTSMRLRTVILRACRACRAQEGGCIAWFRRVRLGRKRERKKSGKHSKGTGGRIHTTSAKRLSGLNGTGSISRLLLSSMPRKWLMPPPPHPAPPPIFPSDPFIPSRPVRQTLSEARLTRCSDGIFRPPSAVRLQGATPLSYPFEYRRSPSFLFKSSHRPSALLFF